MQQHRGFWRWYGVPVLVALGLLCVLNALYNLPQFADLLSPWYFLYTAVVLMAGGSIPSLLLLWRSAGAGLISRDQLGLGPSGWTAPRRLAGLAVIAAYGYRGFVFFLKPPSPTVAAATWADVGFWFTFLLASSLAELLVFIGVGFCLLERGLRSLGMGRFRSTAFAVLFSSVLFGLYHYTHEPRWHAMVFPLMAEMFFIVIFFLLTRNFYLALVLHNLTAAIGFTSEQYAAIPLDRAAFSAPAALLTNYASFAIPFALLHALEWKGWPRPAADAPGKAPAAG